MQQRWAVLARHGALWAIPWFINSPSLPAATYEPIDIGQPTTAGATTQTSDSIAMTAGGTDIGGLADECHFYYTQVVGDFDVRVRVESLQGGDLWAKAALMARASLEPGSASVAVAASPSLLGCMVVTRHASGTTAASRTAFPTAMPHMWLRLRRDGDSFQTYAGVDGRLWTPLGSAELGTGSPVLLGLAASAHAANQPARVVFADLGPVDPSEVTTAAPPCSWEPAGPSSRRTGLAITEIVYNLPGLEHARSGQFIELFNSNPFFEDIGGYRLTGATEFTFPEGTVLPGGGYAVVAKNPAGLEARSNAAPVLGPFERDLEPGRALLLRNKAGAILLEIPFSGSAPWPVAAAGTGHSLALARPSLGEADPRAWEASYSRGGSPGQPDPPRAGAWHEIVLNEYSGASSGEAFIELYNRGADDLDLAGAWLSDAPASEKFQIPAGTRIPGRGWIVFRAEQLGFALPATGATVCLVSPDGTQTLAAERFGPHPAAGSIGRHPDGGGELALLAASTPGRANAQPAASAVVINEIMYHPISENDNDQYVELHNPGNRPVSLAGWRFVDGIDFGFAAETSISAGGFLVVARDVNRLREHYPYLTSANSVGDFQGRLSHAGERLALAMPVVSPGGVTNYAVVEETKYGAGGAWGRWGDGGGSSLELVDPRADRRRAANWGDSDETRKAPWTEVETTGVLDNGFGAIDSLHALMLGAGECLLDNVGVFVEGNLTNLLSNPGFEQGMTGWSVLGDHIGSSLEATEGDRSTQSLRVRASNNGDTGANRIRAALPASGRPREGQTVTLRARARWLRGFPELLLRLKGNYLEAFARLNVPDNLGTPGLPNSRALANAGPAIDQVRHDPPLPAADEPLRVCARVSDPDGVAAAALRYRVDPAMTILSVPMNDEGVDGDAFPGDGIYTATIPGQGAGKLVAFHVEAIDRHVSPKTALFPADAPRRECLARFGEAVATSAFGSYRMWMSAATISNWVNRPVLSNEELDLTFVYGNQRIVYNAGGRFSGSPWHQSAYNSPVGSPCTYAVRVPDDDRLLGTTSFNKIHVPGNSPGDDGTLQCEQVAYWMVRQLGLPWNYQRYVVVHVNGQRRGSLMEDTQVPGTEVVEANFPEDADGDLYKVNGWYEFDDGRTGALGFNLASWATLNRFTTTEGATKTARYRWNWAPRAVGGSANRFDSVVALSAAAESADPEALQQGLDAQVDMDQWLRTFAIEHAVGNWDSFGNRNAQNMYAYKPTQDRWKLLIWDFNIVLGNSGSDGPTGDNLFQYNYADRGMGRIYSHPAYQRVYLRHLQEIAEGSAMDSARVGELVDARYAAFRAAGASAGSPAKIKNWVASRRKHLTSYLTNFAVPFALLDGATNTITTTQNWVSITGVAPLEIQTVRINGVEYPVTWSNALVWVVRAPLAEHDNVLEIRGYDSAGRPVANAQASASVRFDGELETPEDRLVINEIMYRPTVPDAEFIELRNRSSQTLFDLSGYRLDAVGFTFPGGVLIEPGGYLVLARDREAFAAAYGPKTRVAGEYAGKLNNLGETLRLLRPGSAGAAETVVDEVGFSPAPPWPVAAAESGGSLQLVDPDGDRRQAASWAAISPSEAARPRWRFVSATGVASGERPNLLIYHSPYQAPREAGDLTGTWSGTIGFPGQEYQMSVVFRREGQGWAADFLGQDLTTALANVRLVGTVVSFALPSSYGDARWRGTLSDDGATIQGTLSQTGGGGSSTAPFQIAFQKEPGLIEGGVALVDDVQLVLGMNPGTGPNLVRNGNFEEALQTAWQVATNHARSALSTTHVHAGQSALELIASLGGRDEETAVWQTLDSLLPGQACTLSYWYLPSANGVELTVRLSDNSIVTRESLAPPSAATPGRPNSTFPETGNDSPRVLINEWMADNEHTLADPADQRFKDWFELYNPQDQPVDLEAWRLANSLADTNPFVVPSGYVVPAGGYLLVWADGQPGLNQPGRKDFHVDFKLDREGETIALYSPEGTLIDAVVFGAQSADVSQARDASGNLVFTTLPTPGKGNELPSAPNEPPLAIVRVSMATDGSVTLQWTGAPGVKYFVEGRDSLTDSAWSARSGRILAREGEPAAFRDESAPLSRQRFYRIRRIP